PTAMAGAQRLSRSKSTAPRIDPAQVHSDWHNAFSDFTIRLSQRLQAGSDADKLKLMRALQAELTALGAPPAPPLRPSAITAVESQSVDE
ncbi:MAG: hypothetical protein KKF33_07685, partial [Alphaproteobacteria bacterium]|nr:hypothetical protein [Alphaproteobacteria bacterium]